MAQVPVLIVGAGPCGVGLAIELGSRGVECLVVEQSDETIAFPTANLVSTRTMEFLRRWGIADRARYDGFPPDYPNTYLYLTGFNRHELARFEHPGNGDPAARYARSPEGPIWSPKFFFDPVLRVQGSGAAGRQDAVPNPRRELPPDRRQRDGRPARPAHRPARAGHGRVSGRL
jgi:hypothetical protein